MGLPLFVEPAKPVSPSKNSAKDGTIYPSHHPELRVPASRSEIRDRRNGIRRAGVRVYGPMQRTARNSRDRSLPWVESPREQDRADTSATDRRSGMFREALREMTGSGDFRRERLEERMSSLFGVNWRDSPPPPPPPGAGEAENMTEGVDLGWWSVEYPLPVPSTGRSERQQTAASEYAAGRLSPDYEFPTTLPSLFGRPVTRVEITLPRVVPLATRDRPSPRLGNMARNQPHLVRSLSARQQMPAQRATRGVDGLGDRDRSLSPEVWDTLLSTLTPDPQPQSAGSSFASVAASQTAGTSSGTPTTAPGIVDEVQVDTVCESGCECSDNEMDTADYEHPDYLRIRRRRQEVRDRRARDLITSRVPDYNLDGMSEPYLGNMGSMDAEPFSMVAVPSSQRTRNPGEGRTTRRINTPNGSLTIYESTMRLPPSADSPHQSASRATRHPAWDIGPLPIPSRPGVSAQEAERIAVDGPQQNQETVTPAGPSPAEDDWAGMQRIVRSLARREDIPDGWWAEAGLSRILRQGANGSNQNGSRSNDMF